MRHFLSLTFVFITTLLYEGCCLNPHTNDYYFTQGDKTWVVANPRNEYLFIDSLNHIDTFKLGHVFLGLRDPGGEDEHPCVYDRNEVYLFELQSRNFNHVLYFHMSRGVSSSGLHFWLDGCDNYSLITRQT